VADDGERHEQAGRGRLAAKHATQGLQRQIARRAVVLEGSDAVFTSADGGR